MGTYGWRGGCPRGAKWVCSRLNKDHPWFDGDLALSGETCGGMIMVNLFMLDFKVHQSLRVAKEAWRSTTVVLYEILHEVGGPPGWMGFGSRFISYFTRDMVS